MKIGKSLFVLISIVTLSVVIALLIGCSSEPKVGGDRDEHGCIVSAGYVWCEEKQKCLRPWEETCRDIEDRAKDYCSMKDVDAVYICGDFIKVVSSLEGAGSTYIRQDGTEIYCPVVAPEYIPEECKTLQSGSFCKEVKVC